jgi:carboxyl-terminal processing protease
MNKTTKVVLGLTLAVILVTSGFIGGFAVARIAPSFDALPEPTVSGTGVGAAVDEVNSLVTNEALEPPSETSATAGAIRGLLESNGDKYAAYFDPKHFKYFNEEMSGEFGGIGVALGEKDGRAYIVQVYSGTPAQRAGLKSGDIFKTIDGVTRAKWTSDEVVKRVRGKEGTTVKLVFVRPGKNGAADTTVSKTITRDLIKFPNVVSKMKPGNVGYVRLGQFNGMATDEIAQAIGKLEKKGARSFVLDLRDNPGGALDQAIGVSSLFLGKGVVVRVDERGKPEIEYRTTHKKVTDAPLVVLINGNSASASEIVGGALQDYKRATLVGEKSFGKGSVQTIKQLSFGGAVKFTTAHYLTPKKRVINGKGLTPDVVVKMDLEKQAKDSTDIQLQRAIVTARGMR